LSEKLKLKTKSLHGKKRFCWNI